MQAVVAKAVLQAVAQPVSACRKGSLPAVLSTLGAGAMRQLAPHCRCAGQGLLAPAAGHTERKDSSAHPEGLLCDWLRVLLCEVARIDLISSKRRHHVYL